MKTGDSTTYKRQDIPTSGYEKITLGEKEDRHKGIHPTDTNTPKENMGITWSNESKRTKNLKEFYKTHVYTWVSEGNKAWVRVAGTDLGEEE
tara:strand:+ start:200 stop:475 length:276 start_codon:yes stop_codon:yes gene_type:complete